MRVNLKNKTIWLKQPDYLRRTITSDFDAQLGPGPSPYVTRTVKQVSLITLADYMIEITRLS